MRKLLIGILVAVVLVVGVSAIYRQMKDEPAPTPPVDQTSQTHENTKPAGNQTNNSPAEIDEVEIENNAFTPADITVKKGTKVTWTNKDDVGHTVTSDNDSKVVFDSPLLVKGQSYSFTFNEVGTFGYHCQPHPTMTGTVTVIE